MSETLFIHLGNSGINLGNSFWNQILETINPFETNQTSNNLNSLLKITPNNTLIPRALFIDTEDFAISDLNKSKHWRNFEGLSLDLKCDSGNVYPSVKYTSSKIFLMELCEKIRNQVENSENIKSFVICNGTGGGAGSGLANVVHKFLRDEFEKCIIGSVLVFPCEEMGKVVVEPYNSAHSVVTAGSCSDFVITYDNLAIYERFNQMFDLEPEFQEINEEFARALQNFTSVFSGDEGKVDDYLKVIFNEVQGKFITPAFAPGFRLKQPADDWNSIIERLSTSSLVRNQTKVFYHKNVVSVIQGPEKVDDFVEKSISENFNSVVSKTFSTRFEERQAGIYSISNKTDNLLAGIADDYDLIFAKRAYVHWFVSHGMEEEEMMENRENLDVIRQDYQLNTD
jgi:tubulin alpha